MYVVREEVGESNSHTQLYEVGHETWKVEGWNIITKAEKHDHFYSLSYYNTKFVLVGVRMNTIVVLLQLYFY